MSDSIRQTIFALAVARFQGILVSGGYNTDIGQKVFEWRDFTSVPFEQSEVEALSIKDGNEVADQSITKAHEKLLEIQIDFATTVGATAKAIGERLRKIIADFEKAIGVDRKWGVYALDTDYHYESNIGVKQDGYLAGGGSFKFKIKYRNRSFDPYTQ